MKRRTQDRRQREMLLPIPGGASPAPAAPEWFGAILAKLQAAIDRYGVAQIAVWSGASPRAIENWKAGRNAPSFEAAMTLARELPEFGAALRAAFEVPACEVNDERRHA